MTRLRLLPIVVFAAMALLVLKTGGLIFHGGYLFAGAAEAQAQTARAGRIVPPPGREITGALPKEGEEEDAAAAPRDPARAGRSIQPGVDVVGAKADILVRLAERRREIEARESELDMRENLLKAAEKRVEERISVLREIEERVVAIEKKREEESSAPLKGLITMYESMKAKDAARIFSQLKTDLLVDLAEQMNARKMAEILASMEDNAAERLTLAIAERGRFKALPVEAAMPRLAGELPKIEGRKAD